MKNIIYFYGQFIGIIAIFVMMITVMFLMILCLPFVIIAAPAILWEDGIYRKRYKDWKRWAKITSYPFHRYHAFLCWLLGIKQRLECYGN
jgi:cytochrome c oxidase assembly factor CtaG